MAHLRKSVIYRIFWISVLCLRANAETLMVPEEFPSIQSAIQASVFGDIILVGPGVYVENINFLGKRIHVMSEAGSDVTTIDGNQLGSVVTFANGEGEDSILEGFTIQNGSGTAFGAPLYGGGIYCFISSPTILRNRIEQNTASSGGGISCWGLSSPVISENTIIQNSALPPGNATGGGIYCDEEAAPLITGNKIFENLGFNRAGGIACWNSSKPMITENEIRKNRTEFLDGAGIVCFNNEDFTTIRRNLIAENQSFLLGDAIHCHMSSPVIIENVITDHTGRIPSLTGGAIYCYRSNALIASNLISKNISRAGTGILCTDSSPIIVNNLIIDNEAKGPGVWDGGAGIACLQGGSALIVNNTIVGNTCRANEGAAIVARTNATPLILNTILWDNHGGEDEEITMAETSQHPGDPTVSFCIVRGGWSGRGTDNLDSDPLFVDPGRDYHLRFGSPCVDRGSNELENLPDTDYEGDVRILNGNAAAPVIVDIGADELRPEIAARFGTVNAVRESLFNPLLVNGTAGNSQRVVETAVGSSIRIDVIAPPSTAEVARFVLYAWEEESDLDTITPQPYGLGVTGFPTPLNAGLTQVPRAIWNNLGHESLLGSADLPSSPAPTTLLDCPYRFPFPITVTIQGFIEDNASAADGPVSVTNAVVLRVQ